MKKIILLSFVAVNILFTAYAEEVKTVEKATAVKTEVKKTVAPLVSPKKPKPAECVEPAKPATPAEPAKPAEAAKEATPATPAEPAKPAPGTCPPEASKPETNQI